MHAFYEWHARFALTGILLAIAGGLAAIALADGSWLWRGLGVALLALAALGIRDMTQRRHAIIHNFPVVGHLRYLLEEIGPELRQYWVSSDHEELPFNRAERRWIYATAKGENSNFGFGTAEQIYTIGYPIIKHAAFPVPEDHGPSKTDGGTPTEKSDPSFAPSLKVLGETHGRARPFRPQSIINVSAMSFGSLGAHAVRAMNKGVAMAGAYQNTGEGGLSPYHLEGGDVMWQLGTGYFGALDKEGRFSLSVLKDRVAAHPQVRAIEIKLSQGAKPGKGGILPGRKVTPEIAATRGVPVGKDCISPNYHREFSTVDEMIDFIERIAQATGLPVGIKSAIGESQFWADLARRMRERPGCGPDFITIDGGEGGTGAAPLAFADHVALPFKVGFARVYPLFQAEGVARDIAWIGSGKLGFPDRAVVAIAQGCDLIHVAREAMMSIGCIQAQQCHTDLCPAGVATQNAWLQAGLDVDLKAPRLARYLQGFRKELIALAHAAGHEHPGLFGPDDVEFSVGVNRFASLAEVMGYRRDPPPWPGWAALRADHAGHS